MTAIEQNGLQAGEEYANAFLHFHGVLEVLIENAQKQCEIMDNFNVAWELRDDASRGARAVLNLAGGKLSDDQRAGIQRLLTDIDTMPDSVLDVLNVKDEHLRAMNSPYWAPVRVDAKELISLLEPELKRVKHVLGIDQS